MTIRKGDRGVEGRRIKLEPSYFAQGVPRFTPDYCIPYYPILD